jgi:hypothetical protein
VNKYEVFLNWDNEARKWYALNDDIPIALEDASLDNLINRVKLAAPEILEMNGSVCSAVRLSFRMETQAVLV